MSLHKKLLKAESILTTVQPLEVPRRHCERPKGAKQSQKQDCAACSERSEGIQLRGAAGLLRLRLATAGAPRNDKVLLKAELLRILTVSIILGACMCDYAFGGWQAPFLAAKTQKKQNSPDKAQEAKETELDTLMKEHQELKNAHEKLKKDFEAISMDRDNLIAQAKLLLADKGRLKDLEAQVEAVTKDNVSFEQEKKEMSSAKISLEEEIKKLTAEKGQLFSEKKGLEDVLASEKDKPLVKRLEQENISLQKENSELTISLKRARAEATTQKESISRSLKEREKAKEELAQAAQRYDVVQKKYAEAVQKNKILEQKAIDLPKKFTEIARQNKILIKQASNMHYNLGVFYTKNKEYSRALSEFEQAVKLRPDDAYAHFNLGYIYAEYIVNRPRAIEHFRHYLRAAQKDDKDLDWVRKYILTWQALAGKEPME